MLDKPPSGGGTCWWLSSMSELRGHFKSSSLNRNLSQTSKSIGGCKGDPRLPGTSPQIPPGALVQYWLAQSSWHFKAVVANLSDLTDHQWPGDHRLAAENMGSG